MNTPKPLQEHHAFWFEFAEIMESELIGFTDGDTASIKCDHLVIQVNQLFAERVIELHQQQRDVTDGVRKEQGSWFFYDETCGSRYGPFLTEAEARDRYVQYLEWMNLGELPDDPR